MSKFPKVIPEKPKNSRTFIGTISTNIVASLARVAVVSLVALVLPAYLTHHLPVETYSAWVLILQLAAYVSYLDLGVQTGVAKFVAEYDARGDQAAAGQYASAGLVLVTIAGTLGVALTLVLAWQVPRLFSTMPARLYHDVRVSVILVGCSLSFGLVCAVYSAVFLGLQRYWIPMAIAIASRCSFATVVLVAVALQGTLATMGIGVAIVNVATGLAQVAAWRKRAYRIRMSFKSVKYLILKKVARYCALQSTATIAMLCIMGLDVTIVGHYDYAQTAYYSIATLPTSFILAIVGSVMSPLVPASSALSTQRSASELGNYLIRLTRYTTVMLLLSGLPLIICGLPILRLWVGTDYALHTLNYLRVLVFANIIRNLCMPYAMLVCATGKQEAATVTAIAEGTVNLVSSLYLASRFGAIGVACGTVLGSVVSVGLHFAMSMYFTQQTIAISRWRLFVRGILQPSLLALPSLAFLGLWWQAPGFDLKLPTILGWVISTLAFAWFAGLNYTERKDLIRLSRARTLLPSRAN